MKRIWLQKLRRDRGVTQAAAAAALGISFSNYAKIEEGINTPKVTTAKRIAEEWRFDWKKFYE